MPYTFPKTFPAGSPSGVRQEMVMQVHMAVDCIFRLIF